VTERVGIAYEVTGADTAAAAVERLRDAARDTGQQFEQSAQGAQQFEQSVSASSTATEEHTRTATEATQQAIAFTLRIQAAASAVDALATAFGGQSDTARLVARTAQSTAQFAQLGAMLGPQGAVVGGIIGAAIPAFNALAQAQDGSREATERLTHSLDETISRFQRAAQEADRMHRLEQGQGTAIEQAAFAQQSADRAQLIQAALNGDAQAIREVRRRGLTGTADRDPTAIERMTAAVTGRDVYELSDGERQALGAVRDHAVRTFEQRVELVTDAIDQAAQDVATGGPRAHHRGGVGAASRHDAAERERQFRRLIDGLAITGGSSTLDGSMQNGTASPWAPGASHGGRDSFARGGQAGQDRQLEERALQHRAQLEQRLHDERMRQQREYLASIQDELQALDTVGQAIGRTFAQSFQAAITGQEDFGQAFAKGTKQLLVTFGEQMVAEGVGALFTGIGNTVLNPPAAATKLAEGAGKIALGVGLGAAGAAIPTGGGGATGKPASPMGSARDNGGGGSNAPVVINMNAPTVVGGTQAQWGRMAASSIARAQRRYGALGA